MLKLKYANLFSTIFFTILVMGIPLFLAGYLSTENKFYSRAILLILIGVLFGYLVKKSLYSRSLRIDKSIMLYFGFFSILGFTTLIAQPPWEGYDNTQHNQILGLFGAFIWSSLFFSISSYVVNVSDINLIFKLLRYCGVLISLSVYASLFGINFGEVLVFGNSEYTRYFGPLGDQVGFVIVLFSSIALLHHRWPEFIFHLGAILLTGTRGALLSFLISVFSFIYLLNFDKKLLKKLLIVFLSVITISFFLTQTDLGESYLSRFSGEKMDSSSYTRQSAMLYGILLFIENPLLGVGFAGFNIHVWALNPASHLGNYSVEQQENYLSMTTNQYIQTATDGGIFALLLLIIVLFNMLRIVYKATNNGSPEIRLKFRAVLIWMISILAGNQAAVWLLPSSLINYYFFMLGGLALASLHLLRNAKNA